MVSARAPRSDSWLNGFVGTCISARVPFHCDCFCASPCASGSSCEIFCSSNSNSVELYYRSTPSFLEEKRSIITFQIFNLFSVLSTLLSSKKYYQYTFYISVYQTTNKIASIFLPGNGFCRRRETRFRFPIAEGSPSSCSRSFNRFLVLCYIERAG
jgi:hypothetical protein